MKAEHINPFLRSIANTFKTMLSCDLKRGEVSLKKQRSLEYPISGVIGLTGKAVGTVVINLSEAVALNAASTMLMFECTEVNDDVIDAVGEIANMVAGAAKAELGEYDLSLSLPNVVTGAKHDICFPSSATPICVPFECKWGSLQLEVGLQTVTSSVAAI